MKNKLYIPPFILISLDECIENPLIESYAEPHNTPGKLKESYTTYFHIKGECIGHITDGFVRLTYPPERTLNVLSNNNIPYLAFTGRFLDVH